MPKKVSTDILKYNNEKLLSNIGVGVVEFTSNDSTSATSYTTVDTLTTKSTLSTLFNKVSTMFKNIRYLYNQVTQLNSDLDNKQSTLTYSGIYAGVDDIISGNYIMKCTVPSNGTYLAIAYITGGRAWFQGVTDTTSSNYWSLGDCSGGAKILENLTEGTIWGFMNLTGTSKKYPGSHMFLIKLK